MNNQPKPTENIFASLDNPGQRGHEKHLSDETRLTGESNKKQIIKILTTWYAEVTGDCNANFVPDMQVTNLINELLAWHETEKQKLLKQVWNLSQPDIVPDGWKPDTKLGKWIKDNIK